MSMSSSRLSFFSSDVAAPPRGVVPAQEAVAKANSNGRPTTPPPHSLPANDRASIFQKAWPLHHAGKLMDSIPPGNVEATARVLRNKSVEQRSFEDYRLIKIYNAE
jgi:hypothetical protein